MTERQVLWHVGAHGPITAPALAARLKLDPTRLRAHFAALRRRGYLGLDRQGVPDLTARGRRAVIAQARDSTASIGTPSRSAASRSSAVASATAAPRSSFVAGAAVHAAAGDDLVVSAKHPVRDA
jgi:predicted ArsR family transcriptional regulator